MTTKVLPETLLVLREALARVRELTSRKHSGCPDIQIGDVHDVLARVLSEYTTRDLPADLSDADRWVLGQVSLRNRTIKSLVEAWDEHKRYLPDAPEPDNFDNADPFLFYLSSESEVLEAVRRLEVSDLVKQEATWVRII